MESTEVQQIEKQENESDISEMRKKAEEETEENSKEEQEFIVNNAADEQEQASEIDKPQTEEKIDEGTQEKQKEEQKLNEKDGIMAKNFGEEERKVKSILSPGTVFDYKGIVFSLFRLIFFIKSTRMPYLSNKALKFISW